MTPTDRLITYRETYNDVVNLDLEASTTGERGPDDWRNCLTTITLSGMEFNVGLGDAPDKSTMAHHHTTHHLILETNGDAELRTLAAALSAAGKFLEGCLEKEEEDGKRTQAK